MRGSTNLTLGSIKRARNTVPLFKEPALNLHDLADFSLISTQTTKSMLWVVSFLVSDKLSKHEHDKEVFSEKKDVQIEMVDD